MNRLAFKHSWLIRHSAGLFLPAARLFWPATLVSMVSMVSASELQPVLNNHAEIQYGCSVSSGGQLMYFTHAGSDFSDRNIMQA